LHCISPGFFADRGIFEFACLDAGQFASESESGIEPEEKATLFVTSQ
jgi:hypothetical protein